MIEFTPELISTLGFPIAVCIFLLYKDMKREERISNHLDNVSSKMLDISKTLIKILECVEDKRIRR